MVPVPVAPIDRVAVVVRVGVNVEDGVLDAVKVVDVLCVTLMVMEAVRVAVFEAVWVGVGSELGVPVAVQDSVVGGVLEGEAVCDGVQEPV